MKGRKLLLSLILGGIIILALGYYFRPPGDFPSKQDILNQVPEAKTIQDIIFLDDKHVYVPFVTNNNGRGFALWVWRNGWNVISEGDTGEPRIWQVDPNNPDSYFILYNIHPADNIKSIKLYLLRGSYYSVSYGEHTYTPSIKKHVSQDVSEDTYGAIKLPNDWKQLLEGYSRISKQEKQQLIYFSGPTLHFAWNAANEQGEEVKPEGTFGTGSSTTGHYIINPLDHISSEELKQHNKKF
ncbi:hypothetical protein [Radiobacillus deserti]|uniref:Uncharacterized protein n=1 Tax=Radiobacillus deserti TaxID=2594883 RepID=A0A516KKR7_9BACI|nr:hypothetical protein [Radiobacillus deserti]QDP41989.1 hypothetical protein FN924_18530 [Radiobacillus deserti]